MSVHYQAVLWNPQKRTYDAVLIAGVLLYMALFIAGGALLQPNATIETLLIRGFGTLALLLLHIILAIGPLARLDRRFLPLLYNRRHFGVLMFVLALAHGALSLVQFHALGNVDPLTSLFTSHRPGPPFQIFGFAALLVLFLMASTSHDFWLKVLTPPVWKALHMSVYAAYALLIAHVAFGALRQEAHAAGVVVLAAGMGALIVLHIASARRERRLDSVPVDRSADSAGFVDVADAAAIPDSRAVVVTLAGERVAIFRNGDRLSAISNVCRHQNGPLGEGRIVDGCVTCPWHGYQYKPECALTIPPSTSATSRKRRPGRRGF